ncbi:unnamed protein product, partial [Amoebophrya sp. A25]
HDSREEPHQGHSQGGEGHSQRDQETQHSEKGDHGTRVAGSHVVYGTAADIVVENTVGGRDSAVEDIRENETLFVQQGDEDGVRGDVRQHHNSGEEAVTHHPNTVAGDGTSQHSTSEQQHSGQVGQVRSSKETSRSTSKAHSTSSEATREHGHHRRLKKRREANAFAVADQEEADLRDHNAPFLLEKSQSRRGGSRSTRSSSTEEDPVLVSESGSAALTMFGVNSTSFLQEGQDREGSDGKALEDRRTKVHDFAFAFCSGALDLFDILLGGARTSRVWDTNGKPETVRPEDTPRRPIEEKAALDQEEKWPAKFRNLGVTRCIGVFYYPSGTGDISQVVETDFTEGLFLPNPETVPPDWKRDAPDGSFEKEFEKAVDKTADSLMTPWPTPPWVKDTTLSLCKAAASLDYYMNGPPGGLAKREEPATQGAAQLLFLPPSLAVCCAEDVRTNGKCGPDFPSDQYCDSKPWTEEDGVYKVMPSQPDGKTLTQIVSALARNAIKNVDDEAGAPGEGGAQDERSHLLLSRPHMSHHLMVFRFRKAFICGRRQNFYSE